MAKCFVNWYFLQVSFNIFLECYECTAFSYLYDEESDIKGEMKNCANLSKVYLKALLETSKW